MKKTLAVCTCVSILATAVLCAKDFWQAKKFWEWSDKEVVKMLNKSPWAREVEVVIQPRRAGGRRERSDLGRRGNGRGERGGRRGDRPGSVVGPSIRRAGLFLPSTSLTIRWHSALPIRQAIARSRFGDEAGESSEAAGKVRKKSDHYVIGVAGIPPGMFRSAEGAEKESKSVTFLAERLKKTSFLRIKGRAPIPAVALYFPPQESPNTVHADTLRFGADLYVAFPRGGDHHTIALNDKEVEFVCEIGGSEVKRKFKLKDMVYNGQLEL